MELHYMYCFDFSLSTACLRLVHVLGTQSNFIFTDERILLNGYFAIIFAFDRQCRMPQVLCL